MKAFLAARAMIPLSQITPAMRSHAQRKLKFTSFSMDEIHKLINIASEENEDEEIPRGSTETVNEFKVHKLSRMVSVPRTWALNAWPHLKFQDKTVFPRAVKHVNKVTPRDAEQRKFFNELLTEASKSGPVDILSNAMTGAGKSVAFLWLALELQTPSLVIVDSNKLKGQYIKLFEKIMGAAWTKKHVGVVQQDRCDFEGKTICVAMVQSLASRQYPKEFYRHFGMVDFDEVQIFGTRVFSQVFSKFPARVRIGLTATNKKGDFGKIITSHLGLTRVRSKQEVMKPVVYIRKNRFNEMLRFDSDGALYTSLSRLRSRNERLANIVKLRGYDRNRVVLVLSDRIEQLQSIHRLLIERHGIPEDEIGLHVGYYKTDRYVLWYQYGRTGKRQKFEVFDTYAKARHAYNRLSDPNFNFAPDGNIGKAIAKGKSVIWSTSREEYKPSHNELDNITNSCNIILATYKIFAKGVDVPRLDLGIEALPIGDVTQPLGRVLRLMDGKKTPEWISMHDQMDLPDNASPKDVMFVNSINAWFDAKARTRMRGFKKSGAEIRVQ